MNIDHLKDYLNMFKIPFDSTIRNRQYYIDLVTKHSEEFKQRYVIPEIKENRQETDSDEDEHNVDKLDYSEDENQTMGTRNTENNTTCVSDSNSNKKSSPTISSHETYSTINKSSFLKNNLKPTPIKPNPNPITISTNIPRAHNETIFPHALSNNNHNDNVNFFGLEL